MYSPCSSLRYFINLPSSQTSEVGKYCCLLCCWWDAIFPLQSRRLKQKETSCYSSDWTSNWQNCCTYQKTNKHRPPRWLPPPGAGYKDKPRIKLFFLPTTLKWEGCRACTNCSLLLCKGREVSEQQDHGTAVLVCPLDDAGYFLWQLLLQDLESGKSHKSGLCVIKASESEKRTGRARFATLQTPVKPEY